MTTNVKIPRKLNQGMIEALSEYVRKGNYACVACALCDISENQYYLWLKEAKQDYDHGLSASESIYVRLYESIKNAEADAEALMVKTAREAAVEKKDGYLAITVNERRHPDRWGRKDRTQIDITEHKEIVITEVEIRIPPGDYGPSQAIEAVKQIERGDAIK